MIQHFLKKHADKVIKKIQNNGRQIIEVSKNVNFFGQESRGKGQIRGNGVLILTPNTLYYEMWKPNREYEYYLNTINNVENPKWFLGKSMRRELLKIDFINETGQADSAAWLVPELDKWNNLLKDVIDRNKKSRNF